MTNFKKARLKTGMSQKEIAITLGVSGPTVSEWESGKKTPSGKNLLLLSKLFDVSTDYLLGASSEPRPTISNDDVKNAIDEYVKNKGKQSTVIRYNGKEQTYETLDMTDEEWEIAQATIEALRLKRK
nr:MAG TPA: helix-turn-helix domain protein [Caudoviricetes sp.]